jgi:cyanate permease
MSTWAAGFSALSVWRFDFKMSHLEAGFLSGLYYLAAVLIALPATWLFQRFPPQRVFLCSWLVLALGTALVSVARSFPLLCAGRFLFSLGLNVHLVGAPKVLAAWFEGRRELGAVMVIYSMAISLGVSSGLKWVGGSIAVHGWHTAFYLLTALSVVGLLLSAFLTQPESELAQDSGSVSWRAFPTDRTVWLLAIGFFLFNIGADSFLAFTPDYLVDHSYQLSVASAAVSRYAWAAILVKLASAPILKGKNLSYFLLGGCIFGMFADVTILHLSTPPVIAAVGIGIAYGLAMPALYAAPAFLFGGDRAAQLYGLYQFVAGFGLAAQMLIGFTVDFTRSYASAYWLMFAFFATGVGCFVLLFRDRKQPRPGSM